MDLPITQRRNLIQRLGAAKDFAALERLGITIIKDDGTYDCGGYVLKELTGMANEATAHILWSQKRFPDPADGRNVIVYLHPGSNNVQNHGFYEDGWVESKWGNKFPVLRHRIADVPAEFGTLVKFIPVTDDLKARLQYAAQMYVAGRQVPY